MISIKKRLASAVPTPATDKVTLFIDDTGAPKTKNSAGTVTAVGGGGATILQQTAEPTSPATGDLWIDTDEPAGSGGASAWQAHTAAALTAATTNPTLGGGVIDARYVVNGTTVMGRVFIRFGASMTAGSGEYRYVLPVAPRVSAYEVPTGIGYVWIGGGSSVPFVQSVIPAGATYVRLRQDGITTAVGSASPGAFIAGGEITFDFAYEAA